MEKIKILFVQHELLVGGAEKALFDLIHLMDKSKFDITVFAQRNTGPWDEKFRQAGIHLIYDYSCRNGGEICIFTLLNGQCFDKGKL